MQWYLSNMIFLNSGSSNIYIWNGSKLWERHFGQKFGIIFIMTDRVLLPTVDILLQTVEIFILIR